MSLADDLEEEETSESDSPSGSECEETSESDSSVLSERERGEAKRARK